MVLGAIVAGRVDDGATAGDVATDHEAQAVAQIAVIVTTTVDRGMGSFVRPSRAPLLRLLQRRMRPAEIRRRRILADLDDAAADGAGAGEVLEQRLAIVAADGAGEF